MVNVILSHWATYLFLFWVLVVIVGNLWPRKANASRFREDKFELVRRKW